MDDRRGRGEFVGVLGTLLIHMAVIILLILVGFTVPQPDKDVGGVPVMLGNTESARGFDDPSLVDTDVLPEEPEAPAPAETQSKLPSKQDLLTRTKEGTVVLKPKTEPKKGTVEPKEVMKPRGPMKEPEKTETEKAAGAKRLAGGRAERERKAAEEATKKKVANTFGRGTRMGSSEGTSAGGTGTEGSKDGNSPTGVRAGTGSYGASDLDGRSLGTDSLPKPTYNVSERGRMVINITVNPAGVVIGTSINPQTNTVNSTPRKTAEDTARKARFNTMERPNNQTGTVTYCFNLR